MPIPAREMREMVGEVIEFTRSYTAWRELVQPRNRQLRKEYFEFFFTVTNSLLQGFCICTYQLFDQDTRTKSLVRLMEDLRTSDTSLVLRLESAINVQRPILRKIFHIRCNVYAHRNRSLDPWALVKAQRLTPRQMRAAIDLAQDVVSSLAEAAGVERKSEVEAQFRSHEKRVLDDTQQLVQTLLKRSTQT